MILFFDTETTGLVDFKKPANDPSQPRLVQLGAILSDDEGKELAVVDCLVKPIDHRIPGNMIHGISHDEAMEKGVSLAHALEIFNTLWNLIQNFSGCLVAHNFNFDCKVLSSEFQRNGYVSEIKHGFCTMLASTSLVGARQPNGRIKWPKLSEAYKFFFNEELVDAHDALTDVRACKRIYFELLRRRSLQNNQVTNLENAI